MWRGAKGRGRLTRVCGCRQTPRGAVAQAAASSVRKVGCRLLGRWCGPTRGDCSCSTHAPWTQQLAPFRLLWIPSVKCSTMAIVSPTATAVATSVTQTVLRPTARGWPSHPGLSSSEPRHWSLHAWAALPLHNSHPSQCRELRSPMKGFSKSPGVCALHLPGGHHLGTQGAPAASGAQAGRLRLGPRRVHAQAQRC